MYSPSKEELKSFGDAVDNMGLAALVGLCQIPDETDEEFKARYIKYCKINRLPYDEAVDVKYIKGKQEK